MGGAERLPLLQARAIAEDLVALLAPMCQRIEIAGSIRRERPDVGDVEMVCIPDIVETEVSLVSTDMFAETTTQARAVDKLDLFCAQLMASGTLAKRVGKAGGTAWGPALKWAVFRGFAADIFTATPETWGVTLAIRTGSAEFSHKLVTPRQQGGFCPSHLEVKGWRVRHRRGAELLDTPEEPDVFAALGIEDLPPAARTDTVRPRLLTTGGR